MRAFTIKSLFIPLYTEVILFLMSFTFLLLFATNPDLRQGLYQLAINNLPNPSVIMGMILAFLGMIFSIYHAFSSKEKTGFEKIIMLSFAIIVSGGAGVSAGVYLLTNNTQWFLLIFPIWNIVNALVLFIAHNVAHNAHNGDRHHCLLNYVA